MIKDPDLDNLTYSEYYKEGFNKYLIRFFFDNIYLIAVVKIIVAMVQGIIVDQFASLKDEFNDREIDK